MPMTKDEVLALLDGMADGATWDDLAHKMCVRQVVERGLADVKAGRIADVADVRRKYGLDEETPLDGYRPTAFGCFFVTISYEGWLSLASTFRHRGRVSRDRVKRQRRRCACEALS
jgi:hypothetical protein